MRRVCWASSLLNSRSAPEDSSTFQALPSYQVFQRDGPFFAAADTFEGAFSQIKVFKVFEVSDDSFLNVEGLGASRAPRQFLQAFLDKLRKLNRRHIFPCKSLAQSRLAHLALRVGLPRTL
jgi:hypothetical protein